MSLIESSDSSIVWAISRNGPQIIDPNSELFSTIMLNLYKADRHTVASLGRIVVESTEKIIVDPKSVRVSPIDILKYRTPMHISPNGMRSSYRFN